MVDNSVVLTPDGDIRRIPGNQVLQRLVVFSSTARSAKELL